MRRYKIEIEFKGTNYSGWQIQPNAKTIEGELEAAFSKVLQLPIDLIGQGRTDAGVHASGQTAHLDLPEDLDIYKVIHGVNGLVGENVHIKHIEPVGEEFHARFDAVSRAYEYRVLKYPSPLQNEHGWFPGYTLNFDIINQCSELLQGEHDFNGFSKFNEENYTTLCTVLNSRWIEFDDSYIFKIEANRFLRNMVRRMVGTIVKVSKEKISISDFEQILNNQQEAPSTFTAPAKGLTLKKVFYKNE